MKKIKLGHFVPCTRINSACMSDINVKEKCRNYGRYEWLAEQRV